MVVSFGPAAVLFLVAWHVATYLSVQIAEVLPALFEWIGWLKGKRMIRSMVLGLTIAGILLSTLHQGALGALFTYAPGKLHPLWMSANFQWLHFFVSSIFGGLSMLIVVSTISKWFLAWRCDKHFLESLDKLTLGLAKGASFAMITYLGIKFMAIAHDKEWVYLFTGWGQYYLLELTIGVLIPMMIFACIPSPGKDRIMGASLYGSIIPAAWSLMLALRARGIGAAWTTLHLSYEKECNEILGIPDYMTTAVLLPVAYFKGKTFRKAKRDPARELVYWETWGKKNLD